ncbi:hypothetical protein EUTSA_v10017954mg, partial [Eutrema salsugineum]
LKAEKKKRRRESCFFLEIVCFSSIAFYKKLNLKTNSSEASFFFDLRLEPMATIRNLKIKTSTCKRIVKELQSYEKEVEREAAKTADMKEKGADPYDLKQQENVLGESRMMIPDCHKRLESALAELKSTLAELEETDEKEGPEVEDAKKTIADMEKQFPTEDA